MSNKKWLEAPEDLSEAMDIVPIMEQFIKVVKGLAKERLAKDPNSVPGVKLRESGHMTSYEAYKVAKILMDTNILTWDDLLKAMRFSEGPMVKIWADKRGVTASEARQDLKKRLSDVARTKPKSPSVIKDHDAKR